MNNQLSVFNRKPVAAPPLWWFVRAEWLLNEPETDYLLLEKLTVYASYNSVDRSGAVRPIEVLGPYESMEQAVHMAELVYHQKPDLPPTPDVPVKTVRIPTTSAHDGLLSTTVTLKWVCPVCGGPRGEPVETVSYDGSRRLPVHGWENPCGHVDKYADVWEEANKNHKA